MSTVRPAFQFQVGGALSPNAPSYIWRAADRELYQALLEGEFCYILNARQMGKSSLRVQTMRRLRAMGVCCGAVDLTAVGIQQVTLDQWYASIVGSLVSSFQLQIDLRTWWRDRTHLSPVQRLSEFVETVLLRAIDFSIVIFIDEIDSVLSLKFPTDDFFAFVRACYNKRAEQPAFKRLSFALLGVATPSDLIADKTRTPFNIGRAIDLKGFQLQEAMPLTTGFERAVGNPQAVLAQILHWTGGQPLLTQKLCQIVLAAYDRQSDYPFRDLQGNRLPIPSGEEACWVQRLVYAHIINHWERQDEPEHLRTIRDCLLEDKPQTRRVLGLYWQILNASNLDQEKQKIKTAQLNAKTAALSPSTKDWCSLSPLPIDNSPEESELLLSGLVERQQNYLQIKNRIYQEVFNLDWLHQKFNALRPYSQALEDWISSAQQDASRLLRGQALLEALEWSHHKNLSNQDYAESGQGDRQGSRSRRDAG